ncbi:MAG: DivIVA domain-containing protein [Synergistaceae bacterium]|nr:DivIVA domain-containing protein [Synergistaceae bacterium]
MSELLTSLDVVNQGFKKTMRGYDPAEVDEFLDKVAECIQAYVQKTKDCERIIAEQGERLRDYDNIKGSLHEALLMAQRSAEEKVSNASAIAEEKLSQANAYASDIIAEAKAKADKIIRDAEQEVTECGIELQSLQSLRDSGFASVRAFVRDMNEVIEKAENSGKLKMPDRLSGATGREIPSRSASSPAISSIEFDRIERIERAEKSEEAKKQELSNTLNILGIDPSLLNSDMRLDR